MINTVELNKKRYVELTEVQEIIRKLELKIHEMTLSNDQMVVCYESEIQHLNKEKEKILNSLDDKFNTLTNEYNRMISFLTKENRKLVSDVKELRHCAECDICPIKDCELRNME